MGFVLVALGGAVAAAVIFWLLSSLMPFGDRKVLANLRRGLDPKPEPIRPGEDDAEPTGLTALAYKLVPAALKARLRRAVDRAGRPADYSYDKVLRLQMLGPVVGLFAALVLYQAVGGLFGTMSGALMAVLGFTAPLLLVWSKGSERKQTVLQEMPDVLDQMVIAVSAGLGFEQSMDYVSRNSTGPLADEMRRCIQQIQIGLPRHQAYLDMAERTMVPEMMRFVRAVNRANEHGMSVTDVLRSQATMMRMQRRQRAEAAAAKIPTKIVIPLILLIMPVLMVVVMAPPLLRIAHEIMHLF